MSRNRETVGRDWQRGSARKASTSAGSRESQSEGVRLGRKRRLYAPRDRVCTSGLTPRGPRRRHSRAEMRLPSATKGAGSCPVPISTAPDTVPGHRIR